MNSLDKVERFLIILVSNIAPWIALLVPAYLYSKSAIDFIRLLLTYYAIFWTFYFFVSSYLMTCYPDNFYYDGFVYLLRRSDGIFKIGRTINLTSRMGTLRHDYEMDFNLVRAWPVRDRYRSEQAALTMTSQFYYREGKRRELRKMSKRQALSFIQSFTRRVE